MRRSIPNRTNMRKEDSESIGHHLMLYCGDLDDLISYKSGELIIGKNKFSITINAL